MSQKSGSQKALQQRKEIISACTISSDTLTIVQRSCIQHIHKSHKVQG